MNKIYHLILLIVSVAVFTSVKAQTDSLIRFSDLYFHSAFEQEAFRNFVLHRRDTFNLFMAIDETITDEEAAASQKTYKSIYTELEKKKIHDKKLNKKIKLSYTIVHDRFLDKYNDNEYFPVMFRNGTYNCVTASMLYAMVFDELNVPYKVVASSNHVYLVADPGANSVVIETTNPVFEKQIFTGDFKQQYVDYLRTSKLISENEYKNKSVEEIFEEKFNEVKDAQFNNLAGFQYYNKAVTKLQNNEVEEGLKLCQKAYYFYPDNQVKTLLFTSLLFHINKCNFDKVTDIDYLAQFSRFENADPNAIAGIFNNIVYSQLQYTGKELFCDSLNARLVSQLTDKKLIDEINFIYNLQMSYRYQHTDKIENYLARALEIKGNHLDARGMMESYLMQKLFNIAGSDALLDTISQLEKRFDNELVNPILADHKSRAYLQKASDLCNDKNIAEGNTYLAEFEKNCQLPVTDRILTTMIERTYRSFAVHYFYKRNKTKAKEYVDRGLKYVPGSRLIESAMY